MIDSCPNAFIDLYDHHDETSSFNNVYSIQALVYFKYTSTLLLFTERNSYQTRHAKTVMYVNFKMT